MTFKILSLHFLLYVIYWHFYYYLDSTFIFSLSHIFSVIVPSSQWPLGEQGQFYHISSIYQSLKDTSWLQKCSNGKNMWHPEWRKSVNLLCWLLTYQVPDHELPSNGNHFFHIKKVSPFSKTLGNTKYGLWIPRKERLPGELLNNQEWGLAPERRGHQKGRCRGNLVCPSLAEGQL